MDKETLTGKISELDLRNFLDSIAEVFWTAEENKIPEKVDSFHRGVTLLLGYVFARLNREYEKAEYN